MLNPILHLDRSTEVYNLDWQIALQAFTGHFVQKDDVLGFNVSMDNIERMDVGKGSKHLLHYLCHNFFIPVDSIQGVSQASSLTVLHNNVVTALMLQNIENSDDAGVANFFKETALGQKLLNFLLVHHSFFDDFDCPDFLRRLMLSFEDLSEGAFS